MGKAKSVASALNCTPAGGGAPEADKVTSILLYDPIKMDVTLSASPGACRLLHGDELRGRGGATCHEEGPHRRRNWRGGSDRHCHARFPSPSQHSTLSTVIYRPPPLSFTLFRL